MKVYNKLIIDIDTGKILEEDSYNYFGPLALCGGGGSAPAPVPKTDTENALDATQLDLLKQQVAQGQQSMDYQKQMEPFMLESMGYTKDANGVIVKGPKTPEQILQDTSTTKSLLLQGYDAKGNKLSEADMLAQMSDSDKTDYQLNKATKQREMDALNGNLPVDPALEAELNTQQTQAEEVLQRKLGKDWMLSTPGQSLMAKVKQSANLVREEARRGDLTTAAGIAAGQASTAALNQNSTNNVANDATAATTTRLNQMMGFIKGGQTDAFDNSLTLSSKYASERANKQNLAMQQYQTSSNSSSATTGAVIGAVGMAAAAAAK